MKLIKNHQFILISLFLIALVLRIYKLGTTPEALTWDEAALGYNAYSILKTGADEYGYKLPLLLRSFDDYKPALYAYLTAPLISIFGLNIFSIRLVSALSGASLVFWVYLLALNLTRNKNIGLVSSVLATTAPVFLLYSRIAFEANLSLAIFTAGLAFISKIKRIKGFTVGAILLILSAYAYHSARYLVPLIIFTSTFHPLSKKDIAKKLKISVLLSLLFLPIIYFVLNPQFNTRFEVTSIFSKAGLLTGSNINSFGSQYFYLLDLLGRYLSYFNPFQLFIKASGHPLYTLDGIGVFNLWELPFWLVGIYVAIKTKLVKNPLVFVLLIFAPLPAAVTVDWFSPIRALLLFPLYLIFTAIGINHIFKNYKNNLKHILFLGTVLILWAFYALRIVETVFYYQPYVHAGEYQYGFAQSVPYIAELVKTHDYDQIIIDTTHAQPHIFYLLFSDYPPEQYQREIAWRVQDHTDRTNFNFGPYIFREIYWPDDRNLKNTLFVGDVFSLPYEQILETSNANINKEFHSPDGSVHTVIVSTE